MSAPVPVMYAALDGRHMFGAKTLSEAQLRAALHRLPSSMRCLDIVGRADSVLLAATSTTTDDEARHAVSAACDCACVVVSCAETSRIVAAAIDAVEVHRDPKAPDRIVTGGDEWEWCLVLSSATLPAGVPDSALIGDRTSTVVPLAIVEAGAEPVTVMVR